MNLPFITHAIALLLGLLLTGCASIGPQDTDQYIFLDESETLFVKFRNTAITELEMSLPEIAESMRKQRRRDFTEVMEELLHLYAFPIEVHLLNESEKPGDGPVLEIIAFRFEQDRTGDLIATIKAKLTKYGELNTLGTYSQRDVPPATPIRQQMDKAYREVIREPLREMMNDLLRHFPSPDEKESVNAPLTEHGEN